MEKNNLPNRIKAVREFRKMSQKELAEKLETSQQAISLYEAGTREPKIKMWQKLARVLCTTVPFLQGISYDENDILMFINSDYSDWVTANTPYSDLLTYEIKRYLNVINQPLPEEKFTIKELASFNKEVREYWHKNIGFMFEEPYRDTLLNSEKSKTEILETVIDVIREKYYNLTQTKISKAFDDICNNDFYFWKNNKDNLIRFASKKDIQGAINHLQQSLNAFSDELKDLPENKDITFQVPDVLKTTKTNDKHQ